MKPPSDEPFGDDEVLDAAVRCERPLEAVGVEPWHEEVRVLRVDAEELVAHRPADEIRIEVQAADVLLELLPHAPILAGEVLLMCDGFDLDERAGGQLR